MLKFIRLHIYFLKKGKQDAYMYTMSAILMADSRLSYKWSAQVHWAMFNPSCDRDAILIDMHPLLT